MPVYSRDWKPRVGWTSFRAPFRLDDEEVLWRRYFNEYEHAQECLPKEDDWPPTDLVPAASKRAMEIAESLAFEFPDVQRVARWRRHHPTDDWAQLDRWLAPGDVDKTRGRLKALVCGQQTPDAVPAAPALREDPST